jgi:hypothetical protein
MSYVSKQSLEELDTYLLEHIDLLSPSRVALPDGQIPLFTAKGYKHGDAIDLTDRDTSG